MNKKRESKRAHEQIQMKGKEKLTLTSEWRHHPESVVEFCVNVLVGEIDEVEANSEEIQLSILPIQRIVVLLHDVLYDPRRFADALQGFFAHAHRCDGRQEVKEVGAFGNRFQRLNDCLIIFFFKNKQTNKQV